MIALLLFGGSTLKDFAFALLIGVASGAYSSIFIASPVLTHWKEREHGYRAAARSGSSAEFGTRARLRRRRRRRADAGDASAATGRLTDAAVGRRHVSAAEFEQMKRELGLDEEPPAQPRCRR